jgi:hypothetical protein
LNRICHISLWVNIYVIRVQGFSKKTFRDAGMANSLSIVDSIPELSNKKLITDTIRKNRKTPMLI